MTHLEERQKLLALLEAPWTLATDDARREEIASIEKSVGSKFKIVTGTGPSRDGYALCAMSGLPILQSDKTGCLILGGAAQ